MTKPDINDEDLIKIQGFKIESLQDAIADIAMDYEIAYDMVIRIYSRLNNYPHSTDTTLVQIHEMINKFERMMNVTIKEHERIVEKSKEKLK